MVAKFLLALLTAITLGCATTDSTDTRMFQALKNESRLLSKGTCTIRYKGYFCERIAMKDQQYLLVYKDKEPYLIIRRVDGTVIWVAGKKT